jgi:dipeptidyl aminopeptidase/acylaminoacyl peptidase
MKGLWLGAAMAVGAMALSGAPALAQAGRLMTPADINAVKTVADPQVSPDGQWVAYTVQAADLKADKSFTHLFMTSWDGTRTVQLTSREKESESSPRFSPDGRYLAFISGRGDAHDNDQLWVMDRAGGEARKVTEVKGSVQAFDWSPDGTRLALIVSDPDPDDLAKDAAKAKAKAEGKDVDDVAATRPPIVLDRYWFKQDNDGYLRSGRQRLFLLTLADGRLERLTTGDYDEALPAFSPDGRSVAFVSKRSKDPDRDEDWNVYVVPAGAGGAIRALTTFEGSDAHPDWESAPAWSPDGRSIAYLQGGPPKLIGYGVRRLAVVPVEGGGARVVTAALDRNLAFPAWSRDGKAIEAIVEDDGVQSLVGIDPGSGKVTPVLGGRRLVEHASAAAGHTAVLAGDPRSPAEVYALENGKLRRLSHANDAWLKTVRLGETRETKFTSRDGTEVHGFIVTPPGWRPGEPSAAILRIHGGPTSQFEATFMPEWQILAAQGYVVIAANPRGSTGRGQDYAAAIYADWGDLDALDVLAAVDQAVKDGLADPDRLGVGGWSYGGMLTNYVIARDTRFKAATSGASISNILAGYGTDQYIRDYETELGPPWKNPEGWAKISFPFLHADRITTPTLFLVGDKDVNVPTLASEQMYQALRSLGVDTRLVVYPGQYHRLKVPSYLRDRQQRYVDWYAARLK